MKNANLNILRKVANRLDLTGQPALADRLDAVSARLSAFAADLDYDPAEEEARLQKSPEELAREEANELLQPHIHSLDDDEKLMLEHGIQPLKLRGSTSSMLGAGEYGAVYNGVCGPSFQGNCEGEVAVKIQGKEQEGEIWKKIMSQVAQMPPELQKHFPKIYDIIDTYQAYEDDDYVDELPTEMIVMEKLAPLSPDLSDLLFGHRDPNSQFKILNQQRLSPQQIFQDENLVYLLLQKITSNFKGLDSYVKSLLMKGALDFKPSPESNQETVAKDFTSHLVEIGNRIVQEVNPKRDPDKPGADFIEDIIMESEYFLKDMIQSASFPRNYHGVERSSYYRELPETKTLLAALEALVGVGIRWQDLHSSNLMMRPSTGDLVIIDVGLYKMD